MKKEREEEKKREQYERLAEVRHLREIVKYGPAEGGAKAANEEKCAPGGFDDSIRTG